jgi:hypothetical protein
MAYTRTEIIPQHLYEEFNVEIYTVIENGGRRRQKKIVINQSVLQGCALSPVIFSLYLNDVRMARQQPPPN